MRARTHAAACDYALSDACTCGVSPAGLSTEQVIRAMALSAALQRGQGRRDHNWTDDVVRDARDFERYIRGDQ